VLRLKSGNRLKVGEGVSGVKSRSFGVVVFKSHIFRNDGVDWSGYYFGGKSFRRLGSWTINMGLKTSEGLLGSFARVLNSEILCASYCPTSSQIQPTSPRKHENRYV